LKEVTRRQYNRIKRCFEEKELRQKKQAEKFLHRAPSGDARKKESLVRLFADRVDYILIVASFTLPPLKKGLIDRFLMTAFLEDIEPVIVFNKADLLPSRQEGEKVLSLYRSLGYHALMTSTVNGEGIEFLKETVTSRVSLIAGHSGVGKSSLLQAVAPGLPDMPGTGEVSIATGKGVHTTTSVKLYRLDDGTAFYDLPGLKYMSFHQVSPLEAASSFPEIARYSSRCRFDDCLHDSEPGCMVRSQVDEGFIDRERYQSYRRIVESL